MVIEHFPFELPNPPYKKSGWHRARWKATRDEIEKMGGRICGPAEVRSAGGGTGSHLQSSPPPSGTLPTVCDGSALVQNDPVQGSLGTEGDSAASRDDPAWGVRLLP